jgi:enoyl-CoA hydratase/carnithine racemase
MSAIITTSLLGSTRKLVLNRPRMMNVLNTEMCNEIKDLLRLWSQDKSVSAIPGQFLCVVKERKSVKPLFAMS